jgi:hypothetical protein
MMMMAIKDGSRSAIYTALREEFDHGGWDRLSDMYDEILLSLAGATNAKVETYSDRLPLLLKVVERDSPHYIAYRTLCDLRELLSDARAEQPCGAALAVFFGVKDRSYTTLDGRVRSYSGTGVVEMADGRRYVATGHGPTGTADYVREDGYVSYVPVD